jgi:hypothetical protein
MGPVLSRASHEARSRSVAKRNAGPARSLVCAVREAGTRS